MTRRAFLIFRLVLSGGTRCARISFALSLSLCASRQRYPVARHLTRRLNTSPGPSAISIVTAERLGPLNSDVKRAWNTLLKGSAYATSADGSKTSRVSSTYRKPELMIRPNSKQMSLIATFAVVATVVAIVERRRALGDKFGSKLSR